jgi:hypothetical protein
MAQPTQNRGIGTFLTIWFGQLISLIGSGLTNFALGVWVYQQTGSATQFALITFSFALPGILLFPIAGALVDRWDRRMVMIISDTGAGLASLAIALLLLSGNLEIWHIYLAVAASASFNTFQVPAYNAAMTMIVPKEQLGRANGLVELANSVAPIVAPLLAGLLVVTIDLQGVILVDMVTFAFAVLTQLFVRIPNPERTAEGEAGQGSLLREATYGWTYIAARPGLLGLLIFFAVINFAFGVTQVLLPPLVLQIASPTALGTVVSIGGLGMLVGGMVMTAWGGPKGRALGVFGFGMLFGVSIMLAGVSSWIPLIAVASFCQLFWIPLINGCSRTIWQLKVAPDVQGRVFAIRMMIAWSTTPLAYLVAGPLADGLFEPLLMENGALAGSVGQLIGTGTGRGIGFLFIMLGLMPILAGLGGLLNPRTRRVEQEIPDAIVREARETSEAVKPDLVPAAAQD